MLSRYLISAAAAMVTVGTLAAAQAPAPAGQQSPAGHEPATAQKPATIALVGCLVREQAVPGRKPNIAERAGVLEDYILTEATPADQPSGNTQTAPRPTGTAGSLASRHISAMYKVEGIADERLKPLVGKRVEVIGRVDADDERETSLVAPAGTATPRSPADDMPEFEATAIRELQGTCQSAR